MRLTARPLARVVLALPMILLAACLPASVAAQLFWTDRSTRPRPAARAGHAMAYDAARQRVVLFGGATDSPSGRGLLADTWEWDGTTWARRDPTVAPTPRRGHAMACDTARRRIVLFGGGAPARLFRDTWEWDGTAWIRRFPATEPPPAMFHALAYDAARRRTVMFNVDHLEPETWEWDGDEWEQRHPSRSPSRRSYHAMAYDTRRARVVLHGGFDSHVLYDTWEWDGTEWTEIDPPPRQMFPRWLHALVFDEARARVVLYGSPVPHARLWDWDGTSWEDRTPDRMPVGRYETALAYDALRECVVMFGGQQSADPSRPLADTWELHARDPARFEPFGTGCRGSQGAPTLEAAPFDRPWHGDTFTLRVKGVGTGVSGVAALVLTGFSNTRWGDRVLPLDLGPIGMPGCRLLVRPDVAAPVASTAGIATWNLRVPDDRSLVDMTFYNQAVVIDRNANALGAVVSHGAASTIGAR